MAFFSRSANETGRSNMEERTQEKKREPHQSLQRSQTKPLPPLPETRPDVSIQPASVRTEQPEVNGDDQTSRENKDKSGYNESKASYAGLPRPISLPLNMSQSGTDDAHSNVQLQRNIKTCRLKEKPEKWKDRSSEAAHLEKISSEITRLQNRRTTGWQ